jgi:hypothetical protein
VKKRSRVLLGVALIAATLLARPQAVAGPATGTGTPVSCVVDDFVFQQNLVLIRTEEGLHKAADEGRWVLLPAPSLLFGESRTRWNDLRLCRGL